MLSNPNVSHYIQDHARVEKQLAGQHVPWLQQLRQNALEKFSHCGFPTQRDEEWKYTNVASIARGSFLWGSPEAHTPSPTLRAPSPTSGRGKDEEFSCHRVARVTEGNPGIEPKAQQCLVFINGHFSKEHSHLLPAPPNIHVTSIAQALDQHPELLMPFLDRSLDHHAHGFTALNSSFLHDGAFIYLPCNTLLQTPIQLVFITNTTDPLHIPVRNLIVLEKNSQASIIESYIGETAESPYFTNAVTELYLDEQAHAVHYKYIQENKQAYHIGTLQVKQQAHSCFTSHSFAKEGRLLRSDTHVIQAGEHAECILNGLYLTQGQHHVDHHTVIEHHKPHGKSQQCYKGVLADNSRAVFNGKIIVQPGASKTIAHQTNKNLLLSKEAEIDTKPQLEIFHDDIQCTHGAAVGQLSEESLFYLRSRGIDAATARDMLVYAFIRELIERIPLEPLRQTFSTLLMKML